MGEHSPNPSRSHDADLPWVPERYSSPSVGGILPDEIRYLPVEFEDDDDAWMFMDGARRLKLVKKFQFDEEASLEPDPDPTRKIVGILRVLRPGLEKDDPPIDGFIVDIRRLQSDDIPQTEMSALFRQRFDGDDDELADGLDDDDYAALWQQFANDFDAAVGIVYKDEDGNTDYASAHEEATRGDADYLIEITDELYKKYEN
jgi:hypothetical protein